MTLPHIELLSQLKTREVFYVLWPQDKHSFLDTKVGWKIIWIQTIIIFCVGERNDNHQKKIEMLRPFSNLSISITSWRKLSPKLQYQICSLNPSQYGNQKHTSIQHYLVRMLHRVVTSLDKNAKWEINAVLYFFIDWKQAYSMQCHTLGVQSFIENGVRPSLIPLLISYFDDRQMLVRWHGEVSEPRKLPGGGAIGANLGNWDFFSQTNNNADCVPLEDRFKFVDDLSTLEIINLLTIGMSSFNMKQ